MAKKLYEEENIRDIADAIREKTETEDKLKPSEMANAIRGIESGSGGDSWYDTFWDSYQENGERIGYAYGFCGSGWNDTTFKPKYLPKWIDTTTTVGLNTSYIFAYCKITNLADRLRECGISEINLDSGANCSNVFQYSTITRLPKIKLPKKPQSVFYYATKLEIIEELYFSENIITDIVFRDCSKLREVNVSGTIPLSFNASQSPLLTEEDVANTIEHLADLTGKTAQTITFHADVKAKLTEEQIATITNKNWTLA